MSRASELFKKYNIVNSPVSNSVMGEKRVRALKTLNPPKVGEYLIIIDREDKVLRAKRITSVKTVDVGVEITYGDGMAVNIKDPMDHHVTDINGIRAFSKEPSTGLRARYDVNNIEDIE